MKKTMNSPVLLCGYNHIKQMTSGGARGIVFHSIRPGAGFKTGDFVERKVGVWGG